MRMFKKSRDTFLPFILGIIIGLSISYGIRVLSKSGFCRQKVARTESYDSSHSASGSTPDQIVNLAFSSPLKGNNAEHGNPRLCSGMGGCETGGFIGNKKYTSKPRKLLFVGVMTASVYLETRAKAVWETWGKEIPGKVVFFTGGTSYSQEDQRRKSSENGTIPLVPLPGVDDSYPPQKKSFMMIKYMYEHYGDEFEWFMRADDDVYIRSDKLSEFLRSIDSRHLYFIGQAGKGNEVEKGTLNLAHNENFCMGGPGIIMSRPTLQKVAPNVQQCLQDMYSTHEDVEVGRCVQRFAGTSCTWAFEMQSIFHHNSSGDLAFTGKLKRREVHKAMTLHPIKDYKHLCRLHVYFQSLKIQELLYEKILIHRDVLSLQEFIGQNTSVNSPERLGLAGFRNENDANSRVALERIFDPWSHINNTGLWPSLNKYSPKQLEDILTWDFLGKGLFSADTMSPKQKLRSDTKEALEDAIREIMDIINGYSRVRGRIVDFKEILYGYRRINPLHGADYVLDLLMTYKKYRGRKMTIPVRRHVYLQRSFGPLQLRLLPPKSHNTTTSATNPNSIVQPYKLVMIVPLSGRYTTFQRFLDNFSTACTELVDKQSPTTPFDLSLVVVFFGSDEEKEKYLHLVQMTREALTTSDDSEHICTIKMVQIDGEFSRGIALETGISQCEDQDLVFLIDVDLTFTAEVIKRVHLNSVKGQQAYFPIVFSQYNPEFYWNNNSVNQSLIESCKLGECQLDTDLGYWREFGFGIAAFYKSDFRLAGGFDTSIKGWGKEDVSLFDRFLKVTNLTIFRACDANLIHIFHETECDHHLSRSQLDMCLGSRANTLGSVNSLMKFLFYKQKYKNVEH